METRILLLRHAETAEPDRFHGAESDVGLGPRGRLQAEAVAAELAALGPEAVYGSALRRARETAAPIARACGRDLQIVPALHERVMGSLSGTLRDQTLPTYRATAALWMAGDLDATHEGGESYAAIRARVVPAFLELAERHRGGTIVVVAHGVVLRVLLTSLLDELSPADFERVGIDFVAVNDLRWDGARWRLAGRDDPMSPGPTLSFR